jgi:DNA-binding MarR family transcriptional regulator
MDDDKKLIYLIFNAGRMIKEKVRSIACSSYIELEILSFTARAKNPTMQDIAKYLHIKPPSATSMIKGLVRKNKLKRVKDKNDRRIVRIELTKLGKNLLKKRYEILFKNIEKTFSKVSKKDKKTLISIIEKLNQ